MSVLSTNVDSNTASREGIRTCAQCGRLRWLRRLLIADGSTSQWFHQRTEAFPGRLESWHPEDKPACRVSDPTSILAM